MNTNFFNRKSYGAIFVEKAEDVEKVKNIVRRMDEFEADFLPEGLIQVFDPDKLSAGEVLKVDLVNTGKFEVINLNELQLRCWLAGVKIFVWRGGMINGAKEIFPKWAEQEN